MNACVIVCANCRILTCNKHKTTPSLTHCHMTKQHTRPRHHLLTATWQYNTQDHAITYSLPHDNTTHKTTPYWLLRDNTTPNTAPSLTDCHGDNTLMLNTRNESMWSDVVGGNVHDTTPWLSFIDEAATCTGLSITATTYPWHDITHQHTTNYLFTNYYWCRTDILSVCLSVCLFVCLYEVCLSGWAYK